MIKLIKYGFFNKENYWTERIINLSNCSIEFKNLNKENNHNNLFNIYVEDLFSRACIPEVSDSKTKEFFYNEYLYFINDKYNHFFDINYQINTIKIKYSGYYKKENKETSND